MIERLMYSKTLAGYTVTMTVKANGMTFFYEIIARCNDNIIEQKRYLYRNQAKNHYNYIIRKIKTRGYCHYENN